MVMTTNKPISPRLADMNREDAEEVTRLIKENFDSLGDMLLQARNHKAYKALGYHSFESYCQTEFGKSSSSAYQLIEDAKILAQLEAKISENYGEEVILKFPASHLRPLKTIEGIDEKLKAIEYAQKLAAAENRKATKKDLEIAVFEVSGKHSEDFRKAIESLGFVRGAAVEVRKTLSKNSRGLVKRIDKSGKIYIQLYYEGDISKGFDAAELRILNDTEKPARPLNEATASKGDRVLIFAQGLTGKKGTIYQWKDGRQALVTVDGESAPINIAYAELELIRGEQKDTNWDSELVWNAGKNTYYYFPQEDTIYSDKWPQGLGLKPHSHEKSPIDFMQNWEDKFAGNLLEALITPAKLKTLALAQAIELPEDEGKEFAADLIASLSQLFPQASKLPKAMGISFSRTINELTSGRKTQTRRAWQDDYAKNFIRYFDENIAIPALNKSRHRGGHKLGFVKLTQRPYQQYLSEMSPIDLQEEGGMVATVQEFIDRFFEGQDKLVWVLHFEFLATPASNNTAALAEENQRLREQLAEAESAIQAIVNAASTISALASAETTDLSLENTAETQDVDIVDTALRTNVDTTVDTAVPNVDTTVDTTLDAELKREIALWRDKTNKTIASDNKKLANATLKPEKDVLKKAIDNSRSRLLELDAFEKIEIGQIVEKKIRAGVHGKVTKLDFSLGGQPQVWVQWSYDRYPESSNMFSLNYSPVISQPNSELEIEIQRDIKILRENLLVWKTHAEEELAVAEEQNKSIFTRKIETRNSIIEQLEEFSKLRVGQYVVHKVLSRRGKVIAMQAKTERLALEIEWECGKKELTPFKDIVPEQMK